MTKNTNYKCILTLDDSELSVNKYAALMGAKGGKKSRRTLTKKQAQAMVKAREKKKLQRRAP